MGGKWQVLVVLVLVLGQCQAFWWFTWGSNEKDLCKEVCRCPEDLVLARQRGIDCVGLNITSIQDDLDIPKAFGSISFARNHIRSLSSSNFGSSSYLVSLDISENELEGLPARVFAPLQVLSSLNLRNNIISSVDPEAFAGLQNLTRLDISYNKICNLPKEIFWDLTSVEELSLGFNPLGTLNESLLEHTPALKSLDLSKLGLQSIPPNFFKANLMNLEKVSLAYNQFTMVPSKALYGLRASLLYLDLSGNPFRSLDAYSFDSLNNLRSLMLEQMLKLKTIDAYAFGDLTRLETLILRYMPWIETIDAKAFHKTEGSTEVSLMLSDFTFSYSSLHYLPEDLLPWDRLHYISLEFNHWRCDCNMLWVKNATTLIRQTGKRMLCYEPSVLRGYHLMTVKDEDLTCDPEPPQVQRAFGFLVVVMVAGLAASLATISLLVYWQRGWVCRRPPGAYMSVQRTGSTITITDDRDTTSVA